MATYCPHCKTLAPTRTSRTLSSTCTERTHQCLDVDCGHTFVTYTEIVRTIRPSGKPCPRVMLPISARTQPPPDRDQLALTL
ncbi:ogr/Delta-like zinc finger family protein [Chitinimonas koreensis]|uniref:ogr/Delta-like zinc finger family protein n=1 Tax=Chitinimonas koreensis TaxID=356302 RepID=UPI0009FD8D66|nr:ogr/Delta-like zinc finger family protein [Chitinimonas koreensis]